MLKVVIVGCGQIADGHVSEIAKMKNAEVVAVCDLHKIMAKQLSDRFNIPRYYDDISLMLEECRPDVVQITTPPQAHLEIGKLAMDAGSHVYIEKPFGINYSEANELIEYSIKKNVKVTIGYTYYYDPPAKLMRSIIAKGLLGEILHVESFYGYDLKGSFGSVILSNPNHWVHRIPGGLFQNNINHAVTKISEFLPNENISVTAIAKKLRNDKKTGDLRDNLMDELRVIIDSERTSGYLTFSSHIRPANQFATVYGSQNTVQVNYVTRTVTFERSPTLPTAIGRILPAFAYGFDFLKQGACNVFKFAKADFHFFSGLQSLLQKFYYAIEHEGPPPIPYQKILLDTFIMEQIFDQIQMKEAISETRE